MAREDKHRQTKHRIHQQITLTRSLFEEDSVLSKTKEEDEEEEIKVVGTFNRRNCAVFMAILL